MFIQGYVLVGVIKLVGCVLVDLLESVSVHKRVCYVVRCVCVWMYKWKYYLGDAALECRGEEALECRGDDDDDDTKGGGGVEGGGGI